jgi:hypothetical protein
VGLANYGEEVNGNQTLQTMLQRLHETETEDLALWDEFPVQYTVWKRMKAFHIDIKIPDDNYLPVRRQDRNTALPIALGSDRVRIVVGHLMNLDRIVELRLNLQLGQWAEANTGDIVKAVLRRFREIRHISKLTISVRVNSTTTCLVYNFYQQWTGLEDTSTGFSSVDPRAHVTSKIFTKIKALIRILDHSLIRPFLQFEENAMISQLYFAAIQAHETNDTESFHSIYTSLKSLYLTYWETHAATQRKIGEGIDHVDQLINTLS